MNSPSLTEPAKLLLLVALLANDRIISNNGKGFLKEVILRRDPELVNILQQFESKATKDNSFLEAIHDVIKREAEVTYDDIFVDSSVEVGKSLSKRERERRQLQGEKSLIYGEVEFQSFYDVLRTINPAPGLTFYDLGSGTGKALFVARLTQDFARCVGVEILHDLHARAQYNLHRYHHIMSGENDDNDDMVDDKVEVYEGSFLDYDWSDGDVVFANSTCFEDDLMRELTYAAESLKPGAIVVTFTKGMSSNAFELIDKRRHKMSWGPATVFIHRRLRADGQPVGPVRLNRMPSDRDYDGEDDDDDFDDVKRTSPSWQNNHHPVLDDDDVEDQYDVNDDDMDDNEDEEEEEEKHGRRPPPPNTDSPAAPKRDVYGMDIMGSPQDSALLRRKRVLHEARPPLPPAPAPDQTMSPPQKRGDGHRMDHLMGSPQDTALMRRKRSPRDAAAANPPPPPGSESPLPAKRDQYGMDIMSSPQGTALMRRKRAVGKPS